MDSRFPVVIAVALAGGVAHAQSLTTGAIQGRVTDAASGKPLDGVVVWATGQAGEPATAFTASDGTYKITGLLPGDYIVTFFDEKVTLEHSDVHVSANSVTPVFESLAHGKDDSDASGDGSVVRVHGHQAQINPTNTTKGQLTDRRTLTSLPTPGSGFEGATRATAGANNDGVGTAFSGSTGLENRYLVDGVDITGLTYGTIGTPVLNEFIEEIEVISGGYNAEWGRAIGGIVNVVTKTGTNQLHGSVFGTISPGFLSRATVAAPTNASSIDIEANRAYDTDFGVDLGGPIIANKLWFYVGLAPELSRTDYTRITKRQTDCRQLLPTGQLSSCDARLTSMGGFADGAPDVDPRTGFYITDELDREVRSATSQTYSALGKLNLAVSPQHQAQVSVIAVPSRGESPGLYGLPSSGGRSSGLTTDVAARWTSKLNKDRTEIEALIAWHRSTSNTGALDPALDSQPRQLLTGGNLGTWSALGGESARTAKGCGDVGSADPYFAITNCPMEVTSYATGGPGPIARDREDRKMARVSVTERARLAGSHEIKAGLDVEDDTKETARLYSGGALIQNTVGSQVLVTRWVQLADMTATDPRFDQSCHTPDPDSQSSPPGNLTLRCDFLSGTPGARGTTVAGETINWSAYLRDSWQLRPNLTLNAGVRYEEQRLRYAKQLRDTLDPLTGNHIGTDALVLQGNFAPRVGLIWDPTKIGASKIFGAWGRFYESIPMDINDRSFGGEVSYQQTFNTRAGSSCGPVDPQLGGANGLGCLTPSGSPTDERLLGSSGVLVAPGIKAQYLDELLVGAEYQLAPDLKIGVTYQSRRLGRVIEDVSTDGAQTYIIANPGEWSASDQHALEARIAAADDPVARRRLEHQLAMYKGIRTFDKPVRNYDAIELSVSRQFAKGLFVQSSYTYSVTEGNYPGSVSYDNGQIDPNISSQYDLIELLANRRGRLPQDRPHSFKLDGYYTFDVGKRSLLTVGSRVRILSGTVENALGAHYLYGPDESFLLPRGTLGRSSLEHAVDAHLSYGRHLSKTVNAEIYVDLFNVYDNQGSFGVDETYAPAVRRATAMSAGGTPNNVNPIAGGDYADLIWAKTIDQRGTETSIPTARNPNFGKTNRRYAPASARVGFRLTF